MNTRAAGRGIGTAGVFNAGALPVAPFSNRAVVGREARGAPATGSRPSTSLWMGSRRRARRRRRAPCRCRRDGCRRYRRSVGQANRPTSDAPCRVRAGRLDRTRPPARTPSRPPSAARRPRRNWRAVDRNRRTAASRTGSGTGQSVISCRSSGKRHRGDQVVCGHGVSSRAGFMCFCPIQALRA